MGLAASQARLLTITARLADNELRSQTINNAKMRLATQSSQASDEYVTALNNAQLMFSNVDPTGVAQKQALTYNALTSFSQYNNQYGLVNSAGQLLVSEKDAANFKKHNTDLNGFLEEYGLVWDTTFFDTKNDNANDLSNKLVSFYGDTNTYGKIAEFFEGKSNGDLKAMYLESLSQKSSIEYMDYDKTAKAIFSAMEGAYENFYKTLEDEMGSKPISEDGNSVADNIAKASQLRRRLLGGEYKTNEGNETRFVPEEDPKSFSLYKIKSYLNEDGQNAVKDFINSIKDYEITVGNNNSTHCYYLVGTQREKQDIEGKKTKQNDDKYIWTEFKIGELIFTKTDNGNRWSVTTENTDEYAYELVGTGIGNNKKEITMKPEPDDFQYDDNTVYYAATNFDGIEYDYSFKFLNKYSDSDLTFIVKEKVNEENGETLGYFTYRSDENGNVYKINLSNIDLSNTDSDYHAAKEVQKYMINLIDEYWRLVLNNSVYWNLKFDYKDSMDSAILDNFKQYSKDNNDDLYNEMAESRTYFLDLDKFLEDKGTAAITNGSSKFANVVNSHVVDYMLDVLGEPKMAWVDENDATNSGNADAKAQWYTNLFARMQKGYKVLENGLARSQEWMEYAFESGLVTMEQVDKSFNWIALDYKACSNIYEESDTSGVVAKAEAKYTRAMNDIKQKDSLYDLQLKNIDTEHSALQTEYDSIRTVMNKNIDRTMKFDQSG